MGVKYIFTNVIGSFVFDEDYKLVEEGDEKRLLAKHKSLKKPEDIFSVLSLFKNPKYFSRFYRKNLELTKKAISDSVKGDNLILQSINSISELEKVSNVMAKRLREWYELYNPEFSRSLQDHEKFVELILQDAKKEENSMGAEFSARDMEPMMNLANGLKDIYRLREAQKNYLENMMEDICPNVLAITGVLIGAKLFSIAGSLKKLALMPASTVQLLGAEKALFRHMKTGSRAPKHGLLHEHPLMGKVNKKDKGKVARALADKISIASKIDLFKGKFIGDELKKGLEARFK